MSILEKAASIQDLLVKHRRYFHENAEVRDELPLTTAYVMNELKALGYEPKEIAKSAVTATVGGKKPGKVFLLRADMDALPIVEEADVEYKSKTNNMHACGHDFHTAMLLGAAKLLKDHEDEIEGTVKLMFQPAEESLTGAKTMVDAGILENPKVDAAMMIHVASGMPLPTGLIIVPDGGLVAASSDWVKITVQGKGCHGAMPDMGIDPLNVISNIHLSLQSIIAREVSSSEKVVLTIGEIHGGNVANVIPDSAYMTGTLRTLNEDVRKFVKERIEEVAVGIGKSFRADVKVDFSNSCPANNNDKDLRDQIVEYLTEDFGPRVLDLAKQKLEGSNFGSEDFAYISQRVPSSIVMLGAGSSNEGHIYTLHHPKVTFNEDALKVGTALLTSTALKWLKNNK